MHKKILLVALLLSLVTASDTTCSAHIEIQSEDTAISFDKMSLDVYT